MTKASKENSVILKRVLYISYLLRFYKDIAEVKTLIDSGNKFNTILLGYALKLGLKICHINIKAK